MVGEGLVGIVARDVATYLPGQATSALLQMSARDAVLVAPMIGGGLLVLWAAVSLAAGGRALVKRDIA